MLGKKKILSKYIQYKMKGLPHFPHTLVLQE